MNEDSPKKIILAVDDTPANIDAVKGVLSPNYLVQAAVNGQTALNIMKKKKPDLILLDIVMPEMDGYEVCQRIRSDESMNNVPIIFLTAKTEAEDEAKGLALGAVDYITKPISPPILRERVKTHLALKDSKDFLQREKEILEEKLALQNENRILKKGLEDRYKFGSIIGRSPAMQKVYDLVSQAAASDFHVYISGESGTGKEMAARTIYELSRRKEKAFIAVNCSAIADSLFEREFFGHQKGSFTGAEKDRPGFFDEAQNGTLFLDELGELKPAMQVKLLRVLENGEYIPVGGTRAKNADVRIISATNQNLPALVREGKFREDLFYRIHVIDIEMPPLRDRKEDIPLLIEYFFTRFPIQGKKPYLTGKMMYTLSSYDWPGNVRELQNTIQRFLATNQITLPGGRYMVSEGTGEDMNLENGLNGALEDLERGLILKTLKKTMWNRGLTADILKISRWTLHRKMLKYELGIKDDQE
jgi:DNA-binding NtrC family response regulator